MNVLRVKCKGILHPYPDPHTWPALIVNGEEDVALFTGD
jgi:hypothetical protein